MNTNKRQAVLLGNFNKSSYTHSKQDLQPATEQAIKTSALSFNGEY